MADKRYCSFQMAGLEGLRIEARQEERAVLALLHGYAMEPLDLAPLAESMGLPATIYLPQGVQAAVPRGRAWWPVDTKRCQQQLARGPRDLFEEHPPGRDELRAQFAAFAKEVAKVHSGRPLILAGFSQGGMLAADLVLQGGLRPHALALLSASRIATSEWQSGPDAARGLRVLITHGRHDADLSTGAGERLRDLFLERGALVSWLSFDGGHGMPLIVWRELRRLVADV